MINVLESLLHRASFEGDSPKVWGSFEWALMAIFLLLWKQWKTKRTFIARSRPDNRDFRISDGRITEVELYWYPRKKKIVKIYVQSQWRVVLLWYMYHIFWQSSIQRGRHTQLFIITSLKWVIQLSSKFYCWVSKIAFYSPNPHCCLGKLPLSKFYCWVSKIAFYSPNPHCCLGKLPL